MSVLCKRSREEDLHFVKRVACSPVLMDETSTGSSSSSSGGANSDEVLEEPIAESPMHEQMRLQTQMFAIHQELWKRDCATQQNVCDQTESQAEDECTSSNATEYSDSGSYGDEDDDTDESRSIGSSDSESEETCTDTFEDSDDNKSYYSSS